MYRIYDTRTREFLKSTYKSLRMAYRIADRKDLEYGAVRYMVIPADVKNLCLMVKENACIPN